MELKSNIENINEELILIANIFREKSVKKLRDKVIFVNASNTDSTIGIELIVNDKTVIYEKFHYLIYKGENVQKYIKRYAKLVLYKYLSRLTHYKAPWGALTGIRPSKLYYELLKKNNNQFEVVNKLFQHEFLVSYYKTKQIERIIKQQSIVSCSHDSIDLYINIPFCTSKCYYCSFISMPLNKCQHLVEPYVNTLIKEVKRTLQFLSAKSIKLNTIYIGGGTPTSIGQENLRKILEILPKDVKELTVEAGRPDTIDENMLKMLHEMSVTRISINPQSFNNDTLKLIGRNHSDQDVLDVYNLARKYDFVINMDLIAGLGNENINDFKYSINKAIGLNPDNITVHTLSIKRASTLKECGGDISKTKEVEKMVKYSNKLLLKHNYQPYYLYRQKNMLGNLENTGYCKSSKVCIFNINSMEESLSVIACGANAISKHIDYDISKITRHANVKNIEEYIDRIDEMCSKKFALFDI